MIKPFKIKVESESHSREIQEWLFSLGYSWASGGNQVKDTIYPFLYLFQDLEACEEEVSLEVGNCEDLFVADKLPEMWFYDGQLQDNPQTQSQPQIRTYRQVAEAILSGKKPQYLESSGRWVPITYLGIDIRHLDNKYPREVRDIPRICNSVELDPCLTEAPELGANYYYPDPMHVDFYGMKLWNDDADDIYWLELGFVYGSSESAAKHGQAMGITTEG